jgi:kinesin family protein 11
MELDVNDLRDGLEPLDAQICQPLANLREDIGSTSLQEYQPTGATPVKAQYQYPTSLPRTQRHSLLISKIDEDETLAGSDVPEEKEHTIVSREVPTDVAQQILVARQREQAEAATASRELRFRSLVQNSSDLVTIVADVEVRGG